MSETKPRQSYARRSLPSGKSWPAYWLASAPEQWDAPTLCEGWRMREVVAHIMMAFRYSTWQVLGGMIKARGSFNRMADRAARSDAESMSPSELTAVLKENVDHSWKPPGGGYEGALSHDLIHGLDITVALGLDRSVPEDRLRIVLANVQTATGEVLRRRPPGHRLQADDLNWTYGSGRPFTGSTLHGEPRDRFTARPDQAFPGLSS